MTTSHLAGLRGDDGLIRIHGHRGARGVMPENTRAGFAYAFAIGIEIIELDVLSTADGVAVVTHNPYLSPTSTRMPNGAWLDAEDVGVHNLTLNQLQSYDIGGLRPDAPYGEQFPDQAVISGEAIPTLDAVAAMAAGRPQAWLNVEIKSDPATPENTPPAPDYVRSVLEPIHRHGLADRVLLQAFDWQILAEVERQAPSIPRSYLSQAPHLGLSRPGTIYEHSPWMNDLSIAAHDGSLPRIIHAQGGQSWGPYFTDLTAAALAEARALDLIVNTWTVNSITDIDAIIALGVDGIITDYPGRVQRRLLAHGMDWRG